MRRDVLGGKREDGHRTQNLGEQVRRPDPASIRVGRADPTLTGVAGLVPFGAFLRRIGLDAALRASFAELKQGSSVVYPMECQMRLLIDADAVGERRVFGMESLAADPLFVQLAGGTICSLDTFYRDLARMDDESNATLEHFTAEQGLAAVRRTRSERLHCDIDTTVETVFGNQEGAELGYNPRYPGRPSYHPLLSVVAETASHTVRALHPTPYPLQLPRQQAPGPTLLTPPQPNIVSGGKGEVCRRVGLTEDIGPDAHKKTRLSPSKPSMGGAREI